MPKLPARKPTDGGTTHLQAIFIKFSNKVAVETPHS
jgi:hypothetical protein